jgi:hypothetical protein
MRHSYATAALKAGVHLKIVSARLGHSSETFTASVYRHAPRYGPRGGRHRGGPVVDDPERVTESGVESRLATAPLANALATATKTARQMISDGPLLLVAGTGFEPATSGYRPQGAADCRSLSEYGVDLRKHRRPMDASCRCLSFVGRGFRGVNEGRSRDPTPIRMPGNDTAIMRWAGRQRIGSD